MKQLIRKFLPKSLISSYHFLTVSFAAFWYGYPSRKLRLIGVTGTKGKSTTCFLIARILEEAGHRVALFSTALFKIGEGEWLNPYKMTMLGRFALQKFIRDAVRASCDYLVLEVSSEGILQNRHRGIEFDVAVFTNLSPEHLEAHGSFEAYRETKSKLFASLVKNAKRKVKNNNAKFKIPATSHPEEAKRLKDLKINVVNLDDSNADYFLQFNADQKIGYGMSNIEHGTPHLDRDLESRYSTFDIRYSKVDKIIEARAVQICADGATFMADSTQFNLKLLGKFNVYNALAATAATIGEGIDLEVASRALGKVTTVPGRAEFISEGQSFKVMVDYAHESRSLEAIFETVKMLKPNRIIHVFGPTGGGRDKSTRIKLGEISARNADVTIITTDDPYDDDPQELAELVVEGYRGTTRSLEAKSPHQFAESGVGSAKNSDKNLEGTLFVVIDRREAIRKALSMAEAGDLVLITGKGAEQAMVIKGQKIPWDDRIVVKETLKHESR